MISMNSELFRMSGVIGSYPCNEQAFLEVTYVVFLLCHVKLDTLNISMTILLHLGL